MRLSDRRRQSPSLELSMTSMIDVVFLLLIFFIVSTSFVRPERHVPAAIKVDEANEAAHQSVLEPALVQVFYSQAQTVFQIGALRTNDLAQLKNVLNSFENKSEGAFVKAAPNVPFEAAAQAMGACRASGFANVSYLPEN